MNASDPSVESVLRILHFLEERNDTNITTLALVTRLNHHRCIPILQWMEGRGFLNLVRDGGTKKIKLTHAGREYIKILRLVPLPDT